MATFRPTADHFDELVDPLDEPTSVVAEALASLPPEWTVYTRAHVGQDVPDFIAVHEHRGVVTIQVATDRTAADARALAHRHRSTIYEHFFAFPGDPRDPNGSVRAAVVFPGQSRREAAHLLGVATGDGVDAVDVWGSEDLGEPLAALVAGTSATPPSPASVSRLRRELVVGGLARDAVAPVQLSADARLVVANPRGTRVRGVTGPAGCGKSFALTARAARLAAEGKDVLVLCFTLTLADRLRVLVADRCAEYGAIATRVTCTSFHTFCSRVVEDAERQGVVPAQLARGTWPERTVAKTIDVFEQGFERRFDAVLVDEGQDFQLEWWKLLRRHVVVPGGEMLLAADPMIDLRGARTWSDPDTLRAAGFDEPWITMASSYRMAPPLIESTNQFAEAHLPDAGTLLEVPVDQEAVVGRVSPAVRAWRNVGRVPDLGPEMGRQVIRLLQENPDLHPRDVVYLCEYHHDGLAAAAVIEAAGYPVHHVYSRDPDARHLRKGRFWPGADAVKGCTVHSFKGWESPVVVVGIGVEERSRLLAYASMTRVSSTQGSGSSHLVVVNADPRLSQFRPTFELGAPLSALT